MRQWSIGLATIPRNSKFTIIKSINSVSKVYLTKLKNKKLFYSEITNLVTNNFAEKKTTYFQQKKKNLTFNF